MLRVLVDLVPAVIVPLRVAGRCLVLATFFPYPIRLLASSRLIVPFHRLIGRCYRPKRIKVIYRHTVTLPFFRSRIY